MAAASPFPCMSDHGLNSLLFNALKYKNTNEVIQLCQIPPDGPLHITGIHKDTVLHLACYSKQKDLAVKLVRLLPNNLNRRLTEFKNDVGNTLLHETATTNKMRDVATLLLAKEPKLLSAKNAQGETPLFRAARFGKIRMFKLLANEVDKDDDEERRKDQFHSEDKTSILHIAIIAEHFDLAMLIVEMYPELIGMKDGNGMTALQHLACNPSAFEGTTEYGLFKKFIYYRIPDKKRTMEEDCDTKRKKDTKRYVKWLLNLLKWKDLKREKFKHISASELAKELIKKDTSWEATENTALNKGKKSDPDGSSGLFLSGLLLKTEKERLCITSKNLDEKQGQSRDDTMPQTTMTGIRRDETPLFLATSWRIKKLVEEILYNYPQAVEHVNKKGRNILHIAIQYRHLEIFEMVTESDMLSRRLLRATDSKGNSLLHMVGKNRKGPKTETAEGPALDLRDQLAWFERVKDAVKSDFVQLFNHKNQTADDLFTKNYSKLHEESRKWLEETSKNCTIVAVLIATVAFTSAYTVPGGNLSSGMPVLLSQPFFVVFTLADALSLTFALTSVVSFLSILTSPFRLQDFRYSLPQKLTLALTFLFLSVLMMMVAFAATIILMIHTKQSWTEIALSSAAFVPVLFFVYFYSPLYAKLAKAWFYLSKGVKIIYPGRKNPNQHPLDRSQRSGCQITEV